MLRTGNAPAGDYAELLVKRATGGELAPNAQKSWDIQSADGERLQVKARVVVDARKNGERQLSTLRSWDFDRAVIVLFDDSFRVWKAAALGPAELEPVAYYSRHVRGHTVYATDDLMGCDAAEDWTERLRAVED